MIPKILVTIGLWESSRSAYKYASSLTKDEILCYLLQTYLILFRKSIKYHNKKPKEIAKQIEEQGATVVTIGVLKT